ncbi:MAG TPA: trypsin-like peptidase domain-containing protein [Vicinamibacterales bacterium]|nr:trypsin-like peptidase domain-containing protein [Vicinamibacterales bacterium]
MTCRCGQSMDGVHPMPPSMETTDVEEAPASSTTKVAVMSSVATLVIVLGAVAWMRREPPAPPAVRKTAAAPATTPVVQPATVSIPVDAPEKAPEAKPDPVADPAPPAQLSLEDLISKTMPAVVRIETGTGSGSGFFVRPDTILTNAHVVTTNHSVTVRRPDGTTVNGRVERTAPEYDVAVVHVDVFRPDQPTIPLGSGEQARAGQEVVALGSPLGLQNTVTRGIVSAVRTIGDLTLVQTDAAINPGNSGGPLIDRSGDAIGITTMSYRASVAQGLSFAVAIDHASDVLAGRRVLTGAPATPLESFTAATASAAPQPSGADRMREQGSHAYEQAMTDLAHRADDLDAYWRRFKASCYDGPIVGTFDREWFAVFEPRAMKGSVPAGCNGSFDEVQRAAAEIKNGVIAADESARKADVYPGVRRDLRRRFRLDYAGWSR